ncbi:hypothetical protein [Shewanella sp. UCD-FRSSP16_17]|uniref:hypothetical protein n=1 Tax=Shewanella sp. UCD-FRSSP16_17 TaxID=1853256 RepID=UPI0009EF49BE|nr:hypothetical protein [Shewanella sp. UCD-FRSSP16_17]
MNTLTQTTTAKNAMLITSNKGVTVAATMLLTLLTACGGGGGGDDSSPAPVAATPATTTTTTTQTTPTTPETPTDPETPEEPTIPATSIDDLIVDADFDLQAAFNLDIDVALESTQRGYFSLCDQYEQNGAQVTVNFESCLLRGALDEGSLNEALLVANHQQNLVAVVWFYDGSDPIYQMWSYDIEAEEQTLTIGAI